MRIFCGVMLVFLKTFMGPNVGLCMEKDLWVEECQNRLGKIHEFFADLKLIPKGKHMKT